MTISRVERTSVFGVGDMAYFSNERWLFYVALVERIFGSVVSDETGLRVDGNRPGVTGLHMSFQAT